MSGSLSSLYDQVSYALYLHAEATTKLQEQASTGSRINRVSDDPSAAYRMLGLDTQDKGLQNYINNISEVVSTFEISTTVLQSMGNEMLECKKLMTQVAGGIYGEENRRMIADSVNDRLEQMVLLANTKHINQYLFGGTKSTTAPYAVVRDTGGEITSVTYRGSDRQRSIEAGPGVESSVFLVGNDVFRSNDRKDPELILANTGAQTGSGTSSVRGNVWLTVTQDNDDHYVLSIDGGTTNVDLGDAADLSNVAVTNAAGQVLYVDARNIIATGTDMIQVPGTFDIFQTLISIRDILNNNHSLPDNQITTLLPKAMDWITEVNELVVEAQVSIGSRTSFLDNLKETIENMQANTKDEASLLEQADIAQIAIDLSRRQTLYQMTLSVAGKLMSITLLDFLK